jgi:UDP-N-acetylmuramate--alanine ligase
MKEQGTLFRERIKKVHFVGVGGIGMSGIAEILISLGYEVSGSDLRENDNTKRLINNGATIFKGHKSENVQDVDVVVYSSAVNDTNVEIKKAKDMDIPVIPRAEMLAELMRFSDGIAVAGTHGKTTTTSLMATVLHSGKLDPTVVIGGKLNAIDTNAKMGESKLMLVEADESDRSFLFLRPLITCVTNIDIEHMENYNGLQDLKDSFKEFMSSIPFYGFNIVCIENEILREVSSQVHRKIISYGFTKKAHYRAVDVKFNENGSNYDVWKKGEKLGNIQLRMYGRHNVLNSLATVVLALELGIEFNIIHKSLSEFQGVDRRFTIKGEAKGVLVVDDYGHHPTEIRATLEAAKTGYPERRIWAIFQPHRYSRVHNLYADFAKSFYMADKVVVSDIYPAGEPPIAGITSENLVDSIKKSSNKNSVMGGSLEDIKKLLLKETKEGDLILTLGAGSITQLASDFLAELKG